MRSTQASLVKKHDSPSGLVSQVVFQVEEIFPFLEGQFVMIEKEIQWKIIKRPYSIASTSQEMMNQKHIAIVVKKASNQWMSNYLTQEITLGEEVLIKWPVGHYTISPDHQNYLLISTGSWLSPNVGIFKHLVYGEWKYKKIVNVFWIRPIINRWSIRNNMNQYCLLYLWKTWNGGWG